MVQAGRAVKREPLSPQVLSGGQIVSVGREPRGALTSVSVLVNHRLAPSFYFVAFYYHGGLPVANSLRVDVQAGACEGKVTIEVGEAGRDEKKRSPLTPPPPVQLELRVDRHKDYQPGEMLKLQLHTDSAALVALGAVDMALYAAGGKAHKPLDMGKVCEDPLPSPASSSQTHPSCQPPPPSLPQAVGLRPYFPTVCASHLSIPPWPTASPASQPSCLGNSPACSCQVFEVMNSYDLGCGPGGGASALQVFEAAGLAFSDGHRLTSPRNSETRGGGGMGGGRQSEKEGPEG